MDSYLSGLDEYKPKQNLDKFYPGHYILLDDLINYKKWLEEKLEKIRTMNIPKIDRYIIEDRFVKEQSRLYSSSPIIREDEGTYWNRKDD